MQGFCPVFNTCCNEWMKATGTKWRINTVGFMSNCRGNFLTDTAQQQSNGSLCDGVSLWKCITISVLSDWYLGQGPALWRDKMLHYYIISSCVLPIIHANVKLCKNITIIIQYGIGSGLMSCLLSPSTTSNCRPWSNLMFYINQLWRSNLHGLFQIILLALNKCCKRECIVIVVTLSCMSL